MPTINLTDKNMDLLKAVVEINWDEVAKKADMKTAKYARDSWTIVRNKLIAGDGEGKATAGKKRKDSATATSAPVAKKAKVTKGKKAADRSASEDNGDDDEEAAVKKELAGNDDEDAF